MFEKKVRAKKKIRWKNVLRDTSKPMLAFFSFFVIPVYVPKLFSMA